MKPGAPHHQHHHEDFIARDAEAQAAKRTLMKRLKTNSMMNSMSKVGAFIAGPLMAFGLIEAVKFSVGAATALSGGAVAAVLVAGAAVAAVAVVADYVASRSWQSNSIDTQEATAQSTGRHIAQELKKEGMCLSVNKEQAGCETNQRRDGKTWTQAVQEQQAQQATR